LAREFGLNPRTIRDTVVAAGGTLRPWGRTSGQNADRNREIARRYASGESSTALAKEFGLSSRTIRSAIKAAGGTLRAQGRRLQSRPQKQGGRPRTSPETRQAIVTRYQAEDHIEAIARECKVSAGMLYLILHAAGIPLRGPAKGPRKKAPAKVVRAEPKLAPLGAWECPPVHYALRRRRYEEPAVRVRVTMGRPSRKYSPDDLRPAYQQVHR